MTATIPANGDLWALVKIAQRRVPIACTSGKCGNHVPELTLVGTHIRADCPACGKYLKFLGHDNPPGNPRIVPKETPESLALWQEVAPALRRHPRQCRCGHNAVPVLAKALFKDGTHHLAAQCKACGRHLSYYRSNRAAERQQSNASASDSERAERLAKMRAAGRLMGYQDGWADHKYRDLYGSFPPAESGVGQ